MITSFQKVISLYSVNNRSFSLRRSKPSCSFYLRSTFPSSVNRCLPIISTNPFFRILSESSLISLTMSETGDLMTIDAVKTKYPLHYAVWEKDVDQIKAIISDQSKQVFCFLTTAVCLRIFSQNMLNTKDNRKRTPLMLAVTLGHVECAKLLIEANVEINMEDSYGFNGIYEYQICLCVCKY